MLTSLNGLTTSVLNLSRATKRVVVLLVDSSLCVLTLWFAFYLRLGEFVALSGAALWAAVVSVLMALPIFGIFGLYRAIFRYSGWPALVAVAKAVSVYGLAFAALFTAVGIQDVPRTVGLIQPILLLLAVGVSRGIARLWLGQLYQTRLESKALPRALIYGVGTVGRQLADAMASSYEMRVVGFLDDDARLHGHLMNGLPIHSPANLPALLASLNITDVLLALPTASRKRRNEILAQASQGHVSVRTLPSVTELAQGKITVSDLRELDVDDLLGREAVEPVRGLLEKNVVGKIVLVTGAGGSIGSELCRQIMGLGPTALLLVDQSEFALFEIHRELQARVSSTARKLVPLLASVRDEERMGEIMAAWRPDTVYHAAAYKHVPLVEHNLVEGIRNNTLGTLAVARMAARSGVSDFVLISTDKAVRPTNIMGASKRLAEMVLQALAAAPSDTKFTMVRFGNVLGSSGSVVPKFRQQIRAGGPVTVTHPEVTRYFMTIPEAAQLVIQAGAMAKGGDVFVLNMGQSIKIMDLARRMVELSGLTVIDDDHPEGDIEMEIIGLRPGEKLYEELLIGGNPEPTTHPRIMKAHEDFLPWPVLEQKLQALGLAMDANDAVAVRAQLQQLVAGFDPSSEIVDWIHLEQGIGAAALGSIKKPSEVQLN